MTRRTRFRAILAAVQRLIGVRAARSEWTRAWHERRVALEKSFGATGALGTRRAIPFALGGDADVLAFPHHIVGATLYVSTGLTETREHELAICVRGEESWPPSAINRLAAKRPPRAGDTIEIDAVPQPSPIRAFVFDDYGSGVLLAVGITAEELQMSAELGTTALLEELRGAGVYPFTDLDRDTIRGGAA